MSSEDPKTETAAAEEKGEAPPDAAPHEESTAEFAPVVSQHGSLAIISHPV